MPAPPVGPGPPIPQPGPPPGLPNPPTPPPDPPTPDEPQGILVPEFDWSPDLPVLGDNSTKLGLGLWNNALLTFSLEAAVLVGGLWLYLRATAPRPG